MRSYSAPRSRSTPSVSAASEDYKPLSELMQPTLDEMEAIEPEAPGCGVPTGFADLDELTNGLHPGQMVIIAARPAVGKSTLALDFVAQPRSRMGSLVIFSLEMSQLEITMHCCRPRRASRCHIFVVRLSDQGPNRVSAKMARSPKPRCSSMTSITMMEIVRRPAGSSSVTTSSW